MTAKKPRAPGHLQPPTRSWWAAVAADYQLEAHHFRLLQLAGEAWDRGEQAREALGKDGLTVTDDRGNVRAHPLLAVERDCRTAFARLVRELDLDTEAPPSSRIGPRNLASNGGRR